ncbi:MAG: preprotein translocase subunit SecG [Muribaculaceae bacterium]
MYGFLIILIIIASILLIGVVLIQKSKGGGLASGFSSGNQMMGVRKTTDFIEKATWGLAIFICLLSIISAKIPTETTKQAQVVQTQAKETQATPFQTTNDNAQMPATQQPAAPAEGEAK